MKKEALILGVLGIISLSISLSSMGYAAERPATKAEITKLAVGRTVSNAMYNAMYYGKDGSYTYRGGSPGKYTISDGRICVVFNSGDSRCDSIMRDGSNYLLINAQGQRFPFVPN